jgi:hypothetical protein
MLMAVALFYFLNAPFPFDKSLWLVSGGLSVIGIAVMWYYSDGHESQRTIGELVNAAPLILMLVALVAGVLGLVFPTLS